MTKQFTQAARVSLHAAVSAVAVLFAVSSAFSSESVRIETLKTHSRLVLHLDESVPSEWKNAGSGFELTLKGISLADLGAPLGEEERWASAFRNTRDPRLAGLQFSEVPGGIKISGKWKFPGGAAALAEPAMESFEYRDKNPAQLVIDFWLKKGATLTEVSASKRRSEHLAALKKLEAEARERANRKIAAEKQRVVREDMGRFCREAPTESSDVFLPFLPLHESVSFERWIPNTTPDSGFFYFEPKTKERDAQYVRLALNLYRQSKTALVLRTLDFFDSEHPKSEFRNEMRFLRANALIKLGMVAEAEDVLQRLMAEAPEAPVSLHSAMFLAAKRSSQKLHLAALEPFLWLISRYPEHRLSWLFHLGAAESFYGMKQTDRAAKEYQWVIERASDRSHKAEAAIRMGDLFLDRLQYDQSLGSYFQGLNYFEKEAERFPSLYLNRAEALYGLGQFDRAKPAFEDFLKRFPAHPAGWRATYRLGEIALRAGEAKAREDFSETINRYPFSPGTTLARLRLIPCGDHAGLTFDAIEKFFANEAAKFEAKDDVVMTRYPEMRGLAQIRMYISFEKFDRAVQVAVQESIANRDAQTRPTLTSLLQVLFRKQILSLLAEGKKYEALAFYEEKSPYLSKEARAAEPEYLMKLSQAAADLSLGKVAEDLNKNYQQALARNKERAVASSGDESDDPMQRARIAEQRFTEAKALWITSGMASEAQIRVSLTSVTEESPFSFEREIILGLMDEKKGKFESALGHVAKAQLLKPAAAPEGDLRLDAWLASLEIKGGDPKVALEMTRALELNVSRRSQPNVREAHGDAAQVYSVLGVPQLPSVSELILAQAEILDRQARWGEAATTYARAVDAGMGGNQAKYGYAHALIKSASAGERNRGILLLKGMAEGKPGNKTEDFWKQLAITALKNAEVTAGK